jgi:hypothetical protein
VTGFPRRTTAPARDRCDVCAHEEHLHDERIRTAGKPPCSTCAVCAAVPEYACPRCHTPGMVLPFSAHTAVNAEGVSTATWEHGEWSHRDDAECGTCGFSGHVIDFTEEGS